MRRGLPFVMVLCLSGAVEAQDPMKVAPANYKLVLENASVRILRVSVAPGGKSAMHAHPDHMVVSLSAGKVRFTLPDGKTQDSDMGAETAMYVPASSHSPANVGNVAVDAIVIEFKSAGPGTATLPANREDMGPEAEDHVEPRRDRVHPARHGARLPQHQRQARGLRDRGGQVDDWRAVKRRCRRSASIFRHSGQTCPAAGTSSVVTTAPRRRRSAASARLAGARLSAAPHPR